MRAQQPRCGKDRFASQDKRKGNKYTIGRHSYLQEGEYSYEAIDVNGCHPKIFLDEISVGCIGNGGREEKTNKQEGRLFRSSLCTHISMQFSSRKNETWGRFILVSIPSIFVCRDSIFVNVERVYSLPQVCTFVSLDSLLAT